MAQAKGDTAAALCQALQVPVLVVDPALHRERVYQL